MPNRIVCVKDFSVTAEHGAQLTLILVAHLYMLCALAVVFSLKHKALDPLFDHSTYDEYKSRS